MGGPIIEERGGVITDRTGTLIRACHCLVEKLDVASGNDFFAAGTGDGDGVAVDIADVNVNL